MYATDVHREEKIMDVATAGRMLAEVRDWRLTAETWEGIAYDWRDTADRWRRYAYGTAVAFLGMWALAIAVTLILPIKATIMYAVPMDTTIHCPSEDGGRPGCVWDTWTDGNGQHDPEGPRWLVWP